MTVAGSVLTVNPTANLASANAYAIQIDTTTIDDTAGNSFAGITNDRTWNFTVSAPPTLASSAIVDDKNGSPVPVNTLVTYTVTFNRDLDASTVSAIDFGNAGTAAASIGTITETAPGVFSVPVTPTSAGTLQLRVNAAAVLNNLAGSALNTNSPILDDTPITVQTRDAAWSGGATFDADANGDGVNNGTA